MDDPSAPVPTCSATSAAWHCPPFEEVTLQIEPWVPTLAELRQAGAAIMQPDGSYYMERDGQVVHVPADQPSPSL